jgi:uncharacterized ubiquitin-like protein YukD
LSAVLVVLTIIVASLALRFEGQSIPVDLSQAFQEAFQPRINITRSEYEQALAKWKAQKVEEYEITVDITAFGAGTSTLRVSDYGNKVEQLAPIVRPTLGLTAKDIEASIKWDTIEGMFDEIDAALAASNVDWNFHAKYQVSFDPALGYPQHMARRVLNMSHGDRDVTVTSLKIIKQDK